MYTLPRPEKNTDAQRQVTGKARDTETREPSGLQNHVQSMVKDETVPRKYQIFKKLIICTGWLFKMCV